MTLSSEIIRHQQLHAGERIGYGFSYDVVGEMAVRRRRLRLCRRLSAPKRRAERRCWSTKAHAHRWAGIEWT